MRVVTGEKPNASRGVGMTTSTCRRGGNLISGRDEGPSLGPGLAVIRTLGLIFLGAGCAEGESPSLQLSPSVLSPPESDVTSTGAADARATRLAWAVPIQ